VYEPSDVILFIFSENLHLTNLMSPKSTLVGMVQGLLGGSGGKTVQHLTASLGSLIEVFSLAGERRWMG
jgi:hypothetical protein